MKFSVTETKFGGFNCIRKIPAYIMCQNT